MKISYDKEAEALVISFKKGRVSKDEQIGENVFAGYNRNNELIEIQLLDIGNENATWLTVEAAAKYFGKSERTILRWIKSGKIIPKKVGKEYRISPEDLEEIA